MPLLQRQPFVKEKPPPGLTASDEVFFCSMTGEVFSDYEYGVTNLFPHFKDFFQEIF